MARRKGHRDPLATHNERVKLFSGFINALALGFIGFAVIRPVVSDGDPVTTTSYYWCATGLVLHAAAHYILGYMEAGGEDT